MCPMRTDLGDGRALEQLPCGVSSSGDSKPRPVSWGDPGTAQGWRGSPEAPLWDPGVVSHLGSAVAPIHPQGLRQISVIAEGAEIVPSLADPIAGSVLAASCWSQLRRTQEVGLIRETWVKISPD